MKPTRRTFLTGASALSAATLAGLGSSLAAFQASAADTGGYKALVCVFLLDQYQNMQGGSTRARNRLLALNPSNAADFAGREFALPEEMSGIKALFDAGNAAIVGNVGPLIQPITKQQFEDESAPQPKRLFSHNDQQSTWMSSQPEGAQFGWGGRFADAALSAGANGTSPFTTLTSLGNELFLTGQIARPYQIGLEGAPEIEALNFFTPNGDASGEQIYQKLRDHFEAMDFNRSNLIERDIANTMRGALATNEAFNTALENLQPFTTTFPQDFLGQQLQAVARTIAIKDSLLVNRQVFFVAIGGFDTHSNQVGDLPGLQREIDGGVVAFHNAMQEIGLGNDVTLFTASDFGRTLAINGDGTDHGWGSHHFIVGNAVQGGQIYGEMPPYDLGHAQDAGNGRLIPTTSVEQFAEPLGRWFGLNDTEIANALPNLSNFTGPGLGFV